VDVPRVTAHKVGIGFFEERKHWVGKSGVIAGTTVTLLVIGRCKVLAGFIGRSAFNLAEVAALALTD